MTFRTLLGDYVARHAGCVRGAILCDHEGERIDAACDARTGTFELDVVGATFSTWLPHVTTCMTDDVRMRVVLGSSTLWIVPLTERCYLLVLCDRGRDAPVSSTMATLAAALCTHL